MGCTKRNNPNFEMSQLLNCKLINKPFCVAVLLDDEQYIADIHRDGALKLWLEGYIARHCLPVTIEGQAYKLTLSIHNRRT